MGFIAFDGEEGIADKKKLNDLWEKFIKRNKGIIAYNNSHEKKGSLTSFLPVFVWQEEEGRTLWFCLS